jgi:hypothetical protein
VSDSLYGVALTLALVSEVPLVWLAYRRAGVSTARIVGVAVATNLYTHGTLWSVLPSLAGPSWALVAGAESVVCLVEATSYGLLLAGTRRRALAVSALANALSMSLGLLWWGV